jgi:SNF2 family DNA or RNA helicase
LNTLRDRMGPCLLRRVRSEVLEQLPPRRDLEVPVPLTPAQVDRHSSFQRPIAQLARIAGLRPLTPDEHLKLMRLLLAQRVVCNGLALADFAEAWPDLSGIARPDRHLQALDSPKLTAFRELITSLAVEQGRKVIVFSEWRRMLRLAHWAVRDVLHEAGLRAVFFTGAESQRLRTQGIVELHDDPETRVMFLTDAGGVGLNLQRAASACINLELPWNPAVLEQRVSRIYRLGQNDPVEIYRVVATEGIESKIAGLVERKRQLFQGLFDGDSDTIDFDQGPSLVEQLGLTGSASVVRGAPSPEPGDDEDPDPVEVDDDTAGTEEDDRLDDVTASSPPVRELFRGLQVKRREDGSMVIDAPPEAASALADVLEGMAKMLRGLL